MSGERATINVGGRRYRRWKQPQRCETQSPNYDRPRGWAPTVRRCGKPATHSVLGAETWALYVCAECAASLGPRCPTLTIVAGIYDAA